MTGRDWLSHKGDGCPVPPETIVDIECRDGFVAHRTKAGRWQVEPDWWTHTDSGDDITGYRVVAS